MVKFRQQAQKSHPAYAVKIFFGISVSWLRFPSQEVFQEPAHGMACKLDSKRSVSGEAVKQKEKFQGGIWGNTENTENGKSISKLEEDVESSGYGLASPLLLG